MPISELLLQRSRYFSGLAAELAGMGGRDVRVLWLMEPGGVEWVTWRGSRSILQEEQVRTSAVREGLPGPDPASGQGTSCLIYPGPFQPCSSVFLHCERCWHSHMAAGSSHYPVLNQWHPALRMQLGSLGQAVSISKVRKTTNSHKLYIPRDLWCVQRMSVMFCEGL